MAEPKLRFKREDGIEFPEWEKTKLNSVCDIVGGGTPSTEHEEYWNGNIQWFTPSEIGKNKYVSKSNRTISQIGLERSSARKLPVGTVLLTTRATLGEMAITATECTTNQGFQSLIPQKICGEYLYYLQPAIKNYCNKKACGSTFSEISKSELGKCVIPYPCIEEQQKIADFLSNVDRIITQSEAEVLNFEQQKKAAIQKIFLQEVRFKREDGTEFPEWKSYIIGDLFYRVSERNNGQFDKTKWISVAKMYYQVPDKVTSNNIDTRTYVMRLGDMAFEGHPNSDFLFGRFVVNDIGDGVISELFPIYRHKTNYVLKYWKYAIQIESIMAHIYRRSITSSGASSNKLNDNDFLNERILVPCLEEQQKIADFLFAYDEAITYAKQELDKWKELKKGLLQQMFV